MSHLGCGVGTQKTAAKRDCVLRWTNRGEVRAKECTLPIAPGVVVVLLHCTLEKCVGYASQTVSMLKTKPERTGEQHDMTNGITRHKA